MAEPNRSAEKLEDGDIFFLYRPRVNETEPSGIDDVQRFYIVLRPHGGGRVRSLVIGRKRMPDTQTHERVWGFVDAVADEAAELEPDFRGETYETKTRGEQTQPSVRPAGEGVYVVSLEDGQLHLSYKLELPEKTGTVADAFNILPEASYALSIKNPERGQPEAAGLNPDEKADYPEDLQKKFRERRFSREDIELLNYENAEFILIGARTDPESEYDIGIDTQKESYSDADIVRRLKMVKSRHPVEPLFKGEWA